MADAVLRSAASAEQCLEAARYVAKLFSGALTGASPLFEVRLPPGAVNPQLIIDIKDDLPALDEYVQLKVAIARERNGGTLIKVQSQTGLNYMTGALGFEADAVSAFVTTLEATLAAKLNQTRLPTFPAPPRPPNR